MSENFVSSSNATSLITKVGERLELRPKTWTGSHDEWDALTPAQQAEYDYVNFNDDMTDDYIQIDWDEWESMTDAERAQIKRGTVVNVPGLDAGIKVELFKLLWSNPDPTSTFDAQNITLADNDYDFLLFMYKYGASDTDPYSNSEIVRKGDGIIFTRAVTTSSESYTIVRQRTAKYVDNKTYNILACYTQSSNAERTTTNEYLIPIAIYGIKKSIDITINSLGCEVFPQPRLFKLSGYYLPQAVTVEKFAYAAINTGKTLSQLTNGYLGDTDKNRCVINLLYSDGTMALFNTHIADGKLWIDVYNHCPNARTISRIWLDIIAFPAELTKEV